jgi:hypothetical protein
MNQSDLIKQFCRDVVECEYPDELIEFDLAATQIIESKLANEFNSTNNLDDDNYEFGVSATQVLEFIILISGTMEALKLIYDSFKSKQDKPSSFEKIEIIQDYWKDHLVAEGLTVEKADEIVLRFSKDLDKLVEKTGGA